MPKQYPPEERSPYNDELISLTAVLGPMWRSRWAILGITLVITVCGFSWALFKAQYVSHGFFQFGGPIPKVLEAKGETNNEKAKNKNQGANRGRDIDEDGDEKPSPGILLSDFKRYAASYATSERFNDYVQDKKLNLTPGVGALQSIFSSREGISQTIEPVYPFTKADAKVLIDQPKDNANNIIGLRINYQGRSPEIAQQMVGLLGRYAMDSIIYFIYSDLLRFKRDEIQIKITQLDSTIINKKIELERYARKALALKKIITRNPEATGQGIRQVLEITEDNAHYLPPVTLLTTTEIQSLNANVAIVNAKHEQKENMLLLEYYDEVNKVLDKTKSGETVLRNLELVKDAVFKEKNLQDDAVKATYNQITIDNKSAITLYLDKSRFIAGPTLPAHSTARPVQALGVSMVLGFLLSLLFVFGREWWHKNRSDLIR